ncbi:MAG: nitroreductase family protein [Chloroflexota bacterium]
MDTIEDLIRTRRSIRRYQETAVPQSLIEQILNAAMWAPSAHNRQPWRFAVMSQFTQKARLANAMGNKLRQDRTKDGDPTEDIEKDVARSYARLTQAPVIIIICLSMSDMDHYPDEHRSSAERVMTIQSVAMAAQNLLLLAHQHGLGACWVCAPLFVPGLVRDTCQLPCSWEPQGLITLGYPAQEKVKTRQDWRSKVRFLS